MARAWQASRKPLRVFRNDHLDANDWFANRAGQLIVIYNSFTTRPDPNRPGQFLRDAFDPTCIGVTFPATCPGNKIPSNLIDTAAAKTRSLWPAPRPGFGLR
jgi:hypothetical protein